MGAKHLFENGSSEFECKGMGTRGKSLSYVKTKEKCRASVIGKVMAQVLAEGNVLGVRIVLFQNKPILG